MSRVRLSSPAPSHLLVYSPRYYSFVGSSFLEMFMQKQELKRLIKKHKTIRKIAWSAGVSYTTIRYWLKRHGLKTEGLPFGARSLKPLCEECGQPVKRRPNVYCSLSCMMRIKRRIKVETDPGSVGPRLLKNYLFDTRGHCCEVCGITEWMGRAAP